MEKEEDERALREEHVRAEARAKGGRDVLLRQAVEILAAYKSIERSTTPSAASVRKYRRILARIDGIWGDLDKVSESDQELSDLRAALVKANNSIAHSILDKGDEGRTSEENSESTTIVVGGDRALVCRGVVIKGTYHGQCEERTR